jgi:4-amino-4-deoxy-L-arabinose transferase-like glycosyltransferase
MKAQRLDKIKTLIVTNKILFIGLLLLLITRLLMALHTMHLGPYADEDNYISRGIAFLNLFTSTDETLSASYIDKFYYNGYWPPLYSILLSPIYALGEYGGVRGFLAIFDIATAIGFYCLAARLLPKPAAIVSFYLYIFNPFILTASISILSEGFFNFFLIAFLLMYLRFIEEDNFSIKTSVKYVLALGFLMAAAILVRSAFILIFLPLCFYTAATLYKKKKSILIFGAASILMFALTLPWNLLIKHKEGDFMFMHTISAQQFYMKFVTRNGGWNSIKENLDQEAAATGKSAQAIAEERTQEYFKNTGFFQGPFITMVKDFRNDYLTGGSEFEARLRWGLYDSSDRGAQLNWAILIWHEIYRLPIILLGAIGLFMSINRQFRYAGLIICVAIGTASVGLLGLAGGRHLVNLMPLLILGAANALQNLQNVSVSLKLVSASAVIGLSVIGFNIWQLNDGGAWSSIYHNNLQSIGKPHKATDGLQIRRIDGCADNVLLDSSDDMIVTVRSLLQSGAEPIRVGHNQPLVPDDYVVIEVFPSGKYFNSRSIKYSVNGLKGEVPLDKGRANMDWSPLPNTCLRYNR